MNRGYIQYHSDKQRPWKYNECAAEEVALVVIECLWPILVDRTFANSRGKNSFTVAVKAMQFGL